MSKRDIAALAVFVGLVFIFCIAVEALSSREDRSENSLVRDAIKNAALTCYAAEGAYPDHLDYLRTNYGLAYNENKYYVSYDAFASNLMPEIIVSERGMGKQ